MLMGSRRMWPSRVTSIGSTAAAASVDLDEDRLTARDWSRLLATYRGSSMARALFELAVTIVPFVACWAAMVFAVKSPHPWLAVPLVLPTAWLVVRMFAI